MSRAAATVRTAAQRAARSNDLLALPAGVNGTSPAGRRWRDLLRSYSAVLGPERLADEACRARLRNLCAVTLALEQLHDDTVAGQPVALHHLLHASAEQRALLGELGLSAPAAPTAPTVADYVASLPEESSA